MASGSGIKPELLDELLKGQDPKTLFEQDGLLDELKKALAERALNRSSIIIWSRTPNKRPAIIATARAARRF